MWPIIISAVFSLVEKLGWRWLTERKVEKANEESNKVIALSSTELDKRVRDEITRK